MMKRKGKHLTIVAIEFLAGSLLSGQLAYAGGLGDALKQTAVKAVNYVSPTYSQKLNNNIIYFKL